MSWDRTRAFGGLVAMGQLKKVLVELPSTWILTHQRRALSDWVGFALKGPETYFKNVTPIRSEQPIPLIGK